MALKFPTLSHMLREAERMVINSVYWKILRGRGSTFQCKPLSALDWPSAAAIEIRIVPSAIGLPYA